MKKHRMYLLFLFLGLNLIGCMSSQESATTATGAATSTSDEVTDDEPLKVNANKSYVKHREVNRRLIHRTQRLHRA